MSNKKRLVSVVAGVVAAVLFAGALTGYLATTVSAAQQSSAQIKQQIKQQIAQLENQNMQMQAQINALKNQQSANLADINAMMNEKSVVEQQVGLLQSQIRNVNEQVLAYSMLIADKQGETEELLKSLDGTSDMEEGKLSYWSVLIQASSFPDLLNRLNMVDEIVSFDRRRLKEMEEAAKKVAEAKKELQAERESLQLKKAEWALMQDELEIKSEEAKVLLDQLVAKGEEFEAIMDGFEDELVKLEQQIANQKSELNEALEKEESQTVANNGQYMGNGDRSNVGGPTRVGGTTRVDKNGITWVVPCDYKRVSSPFGYRTHPVYGYRKYHSGVDLAASCFMNKDGTTDSPIYATRSGVVTISKYSSSAGYYVTIDHGDGYKSTYMHMCCSPFVQAGQVVAAGQIIGCIGSSGTATGAHLHFGIYKNNALVNPMNYIG